jgi:glycosyltransferase involved in cell wall biosynthesis
MLDHSGADSSAVHAHDLVSVVTIFLNEAAFLEEAIESVRAQTHERWELLLVDDGSSDESSSIARRYARREPNRIRYLSHPRHENRGMSASRNLGIAGARGEFIAFLDGDDVWLPEKLERQLLLLHEHPEAQIVYGPSQLWFGWTGKPEDAARDDWRRTGIRGQRVFDPPELLTQFLKGRATTPATCSVLMRRRALQTIGGFEDSFRGLYEDQVFFSKVFFHLPVLVTRESWDRYRQHADSSCYVGQVTGTFHPDLPHPARLPFLRWLESYLAKQHPRHRPSWKALQREIWLYERPRLNRSMARLRQARMAVGAGFWKVVVPFGFKIGRWVLPTGFRQRLWRRWEELARTRP